MIDLGNHEASNYLWELFHGGYVAPNIYYLGHAGVVQFGGLRIAGMSGIFKDHDYNSGYYEKVFHIRAHQVSIEGQRHQICLSFAISNRIQTCSSK
jgi:lariat debranching enzyme